MNDQISWDQSLVKKYSSSNHFKLLNQLRNEVKKYPLTKKKNISPKLINERKFDSKKNNLNSTSVDPIISNNSDINNESTTTKSTVSFFNNSKNFSIYNSINNDVENEQKESNLSDINKENENPISFSFKDRLNQIDMK